MEDLYKEKREQLINEAVGEAVETIYGIIGEKASDDVVKTNELTVEVAFWLVHSAVKRQCALEPIATHPLPPIDRIRAVVRDKAYSAAQKISSDITGQGRIANIIIATVAAEIVRKVISITRGSYDRWLIDNKG